MMKAEWNAVLARYGQNVTVRTGEESVQVKAFMQNVLDREEQLVPSALGLRREERVLYLGPAGTVLNPMGSIVTWNGADYDVRSARDVGDGHHVWAILQRREGTR